VTTRTTNSNNVGIKTVIGPKKAPAPPVTPEDDDSVHVNVLGGFEDEDETYEREAAHSSPIKAGARLNSHVCLVQASAE
jgi:hypothetical protein